MSTTKKDPFKWIRDIRKKHYEETKNMSAQEKIEFGRKKIKEFENWQKKRNEAKKV